MKTFFTVSVLAAFAVADDFERFIEDVGRAIEDASRDPDAVIAEVARETEREVKDIMEEAECWFADRNNGDGDCEKRRRRAREDECWNTEGMEWDWDTQECMTREQREAARQIECTVDKQGEWRTQEGCPDCGGWCYTAEPYQVCEETGGAFDWDTDTCFASWEEYEKVRQEREEARCVSDGGEWKKFRDEEWARPQCYTGEAWQDCEIAGKIFDWESNTCMEQMEYDKLQCSNNGMEWNAEGWCNWKLTKIINKVPVEHRQKALAAVVADFDMTQIEAIGATVEAGEKEGEDIFASLMEWQKRQEAVEEKAFMDLANIVVDSVTIDGVPLRTTYGGPETWFMPRQPVNAKSIRSIILADEAAATTKVHIEFTGPTEAELNAELERIQKAAAEIGSKVFEIAGQFERKYDDLNREFENAMEDGVGGQAEDLANSVGDAVKKVTDTVKVTHLAKKSKKKQQAAASSNAGMYAGISFGVIGLVAAGAMFAASNKKQVSHNEESLL